jgi:lipopolysaccharide transport system ATP-binding protein
VASLLEVGTGFHPELTGRENIFLNGAILGMKRAEILRQFDSIVAFAETEKFVDTPVKHYSSGMYLRLAFAVAAHLESEILVVDEVLAVGDQAFQQRCLAKMGDAARSGRTVLLVSHNMAAVESLCEQAYLIADGRLAMSGPVQTVVRHYASLATAGVQQSVADRTDRRGSGAFRFVGVHVHEDGKPESPLFSGCDAEISLDYVATASKKLHIAISVLDQHDRMLFACDNEHVGDALGAGERGTLHCKIRDLPLAPGTYRLTVWAFLGGQVADHIQHVAEFTVAPADFFGSGRLPDHPKFGPFLMRHRWSHDES